MADFTWPTDGGHAFYPEAFDESVEFDVELTVSRSGRVSTRSLPGARWLLTMAFPETTVAYLKERRQLEAFLMGLRGGADRLLLWNLLTPQPLGTMSGTVTLAASVVAGDTTAQVTGGVSGSTLLRGDRVSIAGRRVMLTADATANVSGTATISFQPPLTAAASSGAAVTLTRPTTRYVLTTPVVAMPVRGSKLPGFAIELVEE